jgi:hypothetical protein
VTDAVYEMFWDCRYCGQKKLLGLTHRFCAKCGGPQDPGARYFPPEEEKVAVHEHVFVGADLACPACKQPMSRAVSCCTNCGSPLGKGAEVQLRAEPGPPTPLPGAVAPGPAKRSWVLPAAIGVGVLVMALIAVMFMWKREASLLVTGHTWVRALDVQRFEPTRKSDWCDSLPSGARELSRRREARSTKQVPDGETCTKRKKDNGDGTYKEVRECNPKYRSEPVFGDRCDYEVNEWRTSRTATERGAALTDKPRWPAVALARPGNCVGCEREGARSETYTLELENSGTKEKATCTLPEARWATFAKGTRWKAKVRVMTGTVDCDALTKL